MLDFGITHDLGELFMQRIVHGLKRKAIKTPSQWAEAYRIMSGSFPGPWTHKWHPWLKEMQDTTNEHNCGQKCAQVGFSEAMLNTVLCAMDQGIDCLYVLPNKTPDAKDFSASRFDPALELSPYIRKMFSDVKNVGHKRAGAANLYIRGSKSRSGLKSIPTGLIILDERDEMVAANVPLAMERAAGQKTKKIWEISTPSVPGKGINTTYIRSTMEHFFFKCPCCSRMNQLVFPECIEITGDDPDDPNLKNTHYKCSLCKGQLPHETKHIWLQNNEWVPQAANAVIRGFYINQMYSSTVTPQQFAKKYLVSLYDAAAEQEFYNSNLGVVHTVKGAKVNDEMIDNCIEDYKCLPSYNGGQIITMGVDVGSRLHVHIDEWEILHHCEPIDINMHARPRCIWYGAVPDFSDLAKLMADYSVRFCVIDANPERRTAYEFVLRHLGRAKICFYGRGVQGKNINVTKSIDESITVDRTAWLDLTMGRYHRGKEGIILPRDIDLEYRTHIKALVRKYEHDENGNLTGRYLKSDTDADHYAHARNYSEISLYFAALGYASHSNIVKK